MKIRLSRQQWTAAALSVVCAGLGQLYGKRYAKGLLFLVVGQLVLWLWTPKLAQAIRGLVTLGDVPTMVVKGKTVLGDHSIFMMINGLIACFIAIAFALFYVYNVTDAAKAADARDRSEQKRASLRKRSAALPILLLLPALIFVLFVSAIPLLFNVLIAFTDYSAPLHIPDRSLVNWTGLRTFSTLFTEPAWYKTFFSIFAWNIVWAVLSTTTVFFGGMAVAMMINHRRVKWKKLWRTVFILPWAVPQFISLLVLRVMFNGSIGPINGLLENVGLSPVPWLSDSTMAKVTVLLANFWVSMPFTMALVAGILMSIPRDLYEAAEVDGAGGGAKFLWITLPHVLMAAAPIFIMQFAFNFNNFNLMYLLTDGGPANPNYYFAGSTDILLSWTYKMTLEQSQFNMASAVSIILFLVIAIMSIWNYSRTKSFKEED
ncbi:carbohydrate ABC transporter permease [Cohnella faecalis]|uniref:Maltose/maltodextrin transport system permease protein n=1 Tax=Cohnella faecalis TaxID=2315694 RepID=A0A398CJ85_9BACL|nr:sugar ABC transporter permease [Cohnella faecalis]RIE01289.1 sugar ABC transporter permease [Cohnella faecalis]